MAMRKVTQTTPPKKTTSSSKLTNPNYLPTKDELSNMTKEQRTQRSNNLNPRPIRSVKGRSIKGSRK
jgi:hypothetical protein